MKIRIILCILVAITACTLIYCSSGGNHGIDPIDPPQLNATELSLLESSNEFAFNVFKELIAQEDDTNIFISPLSMSYALTMTYNGANSQTEEDMKSVLGFGDMDQQEINASFKTLTAALLNLDPSLIIELANSIWYRQNFVVEQDFKDINRDYFDAEVKASDFAADNACEIINDWIEDKTHDKIQDILKCPISPATVMFLINTIYFKGNWTIEFDPDDTHTETFTSPNGPVDCKMMGLKTEFNHLFTDDFQAIDLPYGGKLFSMTVFLPDEDIPIDQFIADLTEEKVSAWLDDFEPDTVSFYMPKFRFKYDVKLKDVLSALGMGIAFGSGADFTGINQAGGLYINDVIHGSFVQVDEKGTEAAAATIVEIRLTALLPDEMLVDRPFVFLIREKTTGAILFMGKVVNPVWESM